MASKFKRQQRRKRWNDLGTFFPTHFEPLISDLSSIASGKHTENFCQVLLELVACSSTYKEIPQIRKVCDALLKVWNDILASDSNDSHRIGRWKELKLALNLTVEILFFENSRPLHRTILSSLSRFPKDHISLVEDCIFEQCCDYGLRGKYTRPFSTVPVAASITSAQFQLFMDSTANRCSVKLARALISDVAKVIEISGSTSLTPAMMDECQEALSSLYYLIQRFPHNFINKKNEMKMIDMNLYETGNQPLNFNREIKSKEEGIYNGCQVMNPELHDCQMLDIIASEEFVSVNTELDDANDANDGDDDDDDDGSEVYVELVKTLLKVLQTGNLSRDCIVAASVALCALIQIKSNPLVLSLYIAQSFFGIEKSIANSLQKDSFTVNNTDSESDKISVQNSSEVVQDSPEVSIGSGEHFSESLETGKPMNESCFNTKTRFAVFVSGRLLTEVDKEHDFPFLNTLKLCGLSSLEAEGRKFTPFARLCWLRGVLTSMQKEILNANLLFEEIHDSHPDSTRSDSKETSDSNSGFQKRWTLLFDGLLTELCFYCQFSCDSHFKYHAVTSLQMCLYQIKLSLQVGHLLKASEEFCDQSTETKTGLLVPYEPITAITVNRVLQVVWSNWEDPLSQTVKQIQLVFELLLDIVQEYYSNSSKMASLKTNNVVQSHGGSFQESPESIEHLFGSLPLFGTGKECSDPKEGYPQSNDVSSTDHETKSVNIDRNQEVLGNEDLAHSDLNKDLFIEEIALDLVSVSPQRKGRYVPLAFLSQRITAVRLMKIKPTLLLETMMSMADDGVCCAIGTFLKTFLEKLREDCWQIHSGNVELGSAMWQSLWIPPLLTGILSGNFKLRGNLTTYALSVALCLDPQCLWELIETILLLEEVEEKHEKGQWHVSSNKLDLSVSESESFNLLSDADRKNGQTINLEHSKKWRENFKLINDEFHFVVTFPFSVTYEKKIGAIISVLKVCRILGLVDGSMDLFFETPKSTNSKQVTKIQSNGNASCNNKAEIGNLDQNVDGTKKKVKEENRVLIPIEMLEISITHMDDALRIDSAELICLNPKTSAMPSLLELKLMKLAIPLNLRCTSTSFRMRWTSLMKKFFQRIKNAIEKKCKQLGLKDVWANSDKGANYKTADVVRRKFVHKLGDPESAANITKNISRSRGKRNVIKGNENGNETDGAREAKESEKKENQNDDNDDDDEYEASIFEVENFMKWVSYFLLNSLYPNSPYERQNMVMEFLNVLFEIYDPKYFSSISNSHELKLENQIVQAHFNEANANDEMSPTSYENENELFEGRDTSSEIDRKDSIYFNCAKSYPSIIKINGDIFFSNSELLRSAISPTQTSTTFPTTIVPQHHKSQFSPFPLGFFSAESTQIIISSIVNSWDRLREGAYTVLTKLPSPFPGFHSFSSVENLLNWSIKLVLSPRVRESDAGALMLRLIFKKYVIELGWLICLYPRPKVSNDFDSDEKQFHNMKNDGAAIFHYFESLNDWLRAGIEEGERNMIKSCEQSLVHGVLLTMRYTIDEINWTSLAVAKYADRLRNALRELLSLLLKVSSLALSVVSVNTLSKGDIRKGNGNGFQATEKETADRNTKRVDMEKNVGGDGINEDEFIHERIFMHETRMGLEPTSEDIGEVEDGEGIAPIEQMIMVACWLSMKEVSLLLGSLANNVPLPENDFVFFDEANESTERMKLGEKTCFAKENQLSEKKNFEPMLDANQLESIGNHFLKVLLSMKHNGAIDKTKTGFISLCERLLRSNSNQLNRLPEVWLSKLCARMVAKGQIVDDLIRRSAGIPASFLALFLGEPEGMPKKLLPKAMKWLLQYINYFFEKERIQESDRSELEDHLIANEGDGNGFANNSAEDNSKAEGLKNGTESESFGKLSINNGNFDALDNTQISNNSNDPEFDYKNVDGDGESLKIKARDEGVVPTVHAFNTLRLTFHDANLVTDASGFCAEGLKLTIMGFNSQHWEIKNSSCLCFSALLHRTLGYLNVLQRETARRAITGFEFFHRYPSLHPFLLNQLESATIQFMEQNEQNISLTNYKFSGSLHPSLCPILLLLSRLKPSVIHTQSDDWLSPSAFIPFVLSCSTQKHFHIRRLASLALPPLVPSQNLTRVLLELFIHLPISSSVSKDLKSPGYEKKDQMEEMDFVYFPKIFNSSRKNFNTIHGVLLQLCALFKSNCASIPKADVRKCILFQFMSYYMDRSWLGNPNICPCPQIVAEFLRLGGTYLDISHGLLKSGSESWTQPEMNECLEFEQLVLGLCSKNLDMNHIDLKTRPFFHRTFVLAREIAASIYFKFRLEMRTDKLESKNQEGNSHSQNIGFKDEETALVEKRDQIYDGENDDMRKLLHQALTDPMYEVRLSALKSLKKWSKNEKNEFYTFIVFHLRPILLERIKGDEHPLCVRKILSVLFQWKDVESWDYIHSTNQRSVDLSVSGIVSWYAPISYSPSSKNISENSAKNPTNISVQPSIKDKRVNFGELLKGNLIWGSSMNIIQVWDLFLHIFNSTSHVKTKEMTVRCMGACVRQVVKPMHSSLKDILRIIHESEKSESNEIQNQVLGFESDFYTHAKAILDIFLEKMDELSQSYQPVSLRIAATDSIIASQLLEEAQLANFILSTPTFTSQNLKKATNAGFTDCTILNEVSGIKGVENGTDNAVDDISHSTNVQGNVIELKKFVLSEYYGNYILKMWITAIKLLEDENLDIRKRLSSVILNIVSVGRQTKHLFQNFELENCEDFTHEMGGGASKFCDRKSIPCQVEVVIQMSFEHLFFNFGKFFFFFDAMLFWAVEENFCGSAPQSMDMIRKLFDKEIDNHHEEKLLFIQLCLFNVNKQIHHSIDFQHLSMKKIFLSKVLVWQMKTVESLFMDITGVFELQKSVDWFVTITNHQDVFLSLYSKLLALISLCLPFPITKQVFEEALMNEDSFEGKSKGLDLFVQHMTSIGQKLNSITLNPLIRSSLILTLKHYEHQFETNLGFAELRSAKSVNLDEYEPFFLL